MNDRFSIISSALSEDPREAVKRSREIGFAGIVFDAKSRTLDLTELSNTGRREFRHMLSTDGQTLVAIRTHLLPHGLMQDTQRIIETIEKISQAARDLQANCVSIDLGPLPAEDSAIIALAALADRHGVQLALSSSLAGYESLEKILALAKSPWLGVELDPVAVLQDESSETEILSRVGRSIVHVRARDALVGDNHRIKPTEIGRGSVIWPEFLATLDSIGYRGWLTIDPIELPNRSASAIAGLKFLKSTSH